MILVTGGAGYIGSHVLSLLSKEKTEPVVVVDNLSTGDAQALQHNEKLIPLDLSNSNELLEVFQKYKPTTVFHFAASIDVGESVAKPLAYYQNNTVNTLNLLQAAQSVGVQNFIFSSTAAVYGQSESETVSENDPLHPVSPYGWSKLMCEQIIQDLAKAYPLRFAILRYFNVAGAAPDGSIGQRGKDAHHLIKVCLEVAKGTRDHIEIFGNDYQTPDGTGIRDYIHVMDLAHAHIDVLTLLENGGTSQILNVGYGKGYSVLDIIKTVEKVTGKSLPVVISPRRAGDNQAIIANNQKILTLTKWKPRYDAIETIIHDAWNWEQTL